MANQPLKCGDVILINLPSHNPRGHEQEGKRPAVIIGVPSGDVRYLVAIVVPLTTQFGVWARKNPTLYPNIQAGTAGLTQTSVALCDQIRAVDMQRVIGYLGSLSSVEYMPIIEGLRQILGLQQ
ncbi:type II toxin-antitoxin system PemK/MazF family toxin [Tumidithrix elongata RA019]|uniref:Type II toxin-antitoxin system PemK/MazF family toxin n=1 Tax=Tumidithrix elongata BACA0141 TaxID=2716417 RepID=A0AAW9PRW7_9CYAN|nr:type II toxin-antitoxin system PemK/MazF family toxin [Tumidithrix elongata RA019]